MLKIVRGFDPIYGMGEPVAISNRVYMPEEDKETGELIAEEDLRLKEEKQRLKEEEQRAETERRINEEADAKLQDFLARRSAALERERSDIIEQAKKQAADMAADAKAATIAVIGKAEKECVKLKEQARSEGHAEGYAEGKSEALDKYKKYIDAAGKLLSEINSRKDAYYISGEEEMRETVFEMVSKIVGAELKADPAVIDGIIGEAAKNFRNSDYIKITLAEDSVTERFITDKKLMRDIIPFIPEIELEFDSDAEEGTVIIDNGSEIVDASIPTQLDFLKEILRNTRGETDDEEYPDTEEIKGKSQRRKTVTISAAEELDEKPAQETPKPKKSSKKTAENS